MTAKWVSPSGRAPACPAWRCNSSTMSSRAGANRSVSLRRIVSADGHSTQWPRVMARSSEAACGEEAAEIVDDVMDVVALGAGGGPVDGAAHPGGGHARAPRRGPGFWPCLRSSSRCAGRPRAGAAIRDSRRAPALGSNPASTMSTMPQNDPAISRWASSRRHGRPSRWCERSCARAAPSAPRPAPGRAARRRDRCRGHRRGIRAGSTLSTVIRPRIVVPCSRK